jgi:hypothetical protein
MRPYKLIYYIYSTAHALGTCTEHVTSSEDTRDVTILRRAKLDLLIVIKVVLLSTKDKLNGLIKALKAFILFIITIGQY